MILTMQKRNKILDPDWDDTNPSVLDPQKKNNLQN